MSKSAKIGMVLADGRIKAISLSWAGRPSQAGTTLEERYKSPEDIEALLALGNLFQLGTRPEPARNQVEEETTVAYGRDWGFAGCDAVIFADKEDFENKAKVQFYADYLYLFENGKWFVKGTGISSWIELAAVVGMMA